ncbi:hypothetical protein F7725_016852 [Dissostichus mawsoni]|uniref:Uncharacterized protein n=1 Tax=Dissostichus mawsoni TaxID=36200 RepID=A0A7J5Z4X1_DISMA|nr:hypothetical protein F7725_016852 [Dissostichus mawsoni]
MSDTGSCMTWLPRTTWNFCSCSMRFCNPRNCFSFDQSLKAVTSTTHTTDNRMAAPSIQPASASPSSSTPAAPAPQTVQGYHVFTIDFFPLVQSFAQSLCASVVLLELDHRLWAPHFHQGAQLHDRATEARLMVALIYLVLGIKIAVNQKRDELSLIQTKSKIGMRQASKTKKREIRMSLRETVRYLPTKNHQREETEEEKEQQRTRRGGDDGTQVRSIQVSVGQPQWSGPEKGNVAGCKSCRSQAHHGCSPDPLHSRGVCSSRWCTAEGQPLLAAAVTVALMSLSTAATGDANLIVRTHQLLEKERGRDREREGERERERRAERGGCSVLVQSGEELCACGRLGLL